VQKLQQQFDRRRPLKGFTVATDIPDDCHKHGPKAVREVAGSRTNQGLPRKGWSTYSMAAATITEPLICNRDDPSHTRCPPCPSRPSRPVGAKKTADADTRALVEYARKLSRAVETRDPGRLGQIR
jgi:hypothetical protein